MRTFKAGDRDWSILVTVATLNRVKSLTGYLLTDLVDSKSKLIADAAVSPLVLPNLLYATCKPQADQDGVTDEQFGEQLAGDVLGRATEALIEAVIDFFPNARQRELNRTLLGKTQETFDLVTSGMLKNLQAVTPKQILDSLPTSLSSAISTAVSSGSTPAPSLSANSPG